MDIKAFEIALVEKLSRELDKPENWKNNSSGTSSIQHLRKNYLLYLSDIDKSVCLIAPNLYSFVDPKLTNGIYQKSIKIFEDNKIRLKKELDEKIRKSLIDGLESRASKLRAALIRLYQKFQKNYPMKNLLKSMKKHRKTNKTLS